MAELEQLATELASLGEHIKVLKNANPVDKVAIGAAVAELLTKKKLYAERNNGIGVDGKPFAASSKADQKGNANVDKESGPSKSVSCFGLVSIV
jgi:hypothetical protein